MKHKNLILMIAITSFVVLASMFVTSDSLAYFSSSVNGSSNTATATVTTGTWNQSFTPTYDPTADYYIGDIVEYNGGTFQAKTDLPTKEPGVTKGWQSEWTQLS